MNKLEAALIVEFNKHLTRFRREVRRYEHLISCEELDEVFVVEVRRLVENLQEALACRDKRAARRARIAALREVAGRTPEEAALYLRRADELEVERR